MFEILFPASKIGNLKLTKCFDRLSRRMLWAAHMFLSGMGSLKRGEMSVNDHDRSGRPSISRNDETLRESGKKSTRIVVSISTKFQKKQEGVKWMEWVLRRLRDDVWRKRPKLGRSVDWFLTSKQNCDVIEWCVGTHPLSVNRYSTSQGWSIVPHSPYSQDLV